MHEALYTIRLEMNYSKKNILEGYLNTIYYGNGCYGVKRPANIILAKHAKDLSLRKPACLPEFQRAWNLLTTKLR